APAVNSVWTGCYLGGQVGGSWGRKQLATIEDIGVSSLAADIGGFMPGGQVGCSYQFAGHGGVGGPGGLARATPNGASAPLLANGDGAALSAKTNWLASVTGRLGYAWDVWLLYVDGGIAWARDRYEVGGTVAGANFDFTGNETRTGWTAGVGIGFLFW